MPSEHCDEPPLPKKKMKIKKRKDSPMAVYMHACTLSGDFPTTSHNHPMGGGRAETEISGLWQRRAASTTSAGIQEITDTDVQLRV